MQDLTLGLSGKVAIVTGAAGGIGRSTVDLLTAHNVRVVAEDINPAVHELARAGKIVALVGDFARRSPIWSAVPSAKLLSSSRPAE